VNLFWEMTSMEIEELLKSVCFKVTHDTLWRRRSVADVHRLSSSLARSFAR